jgi:hypothetical protein
MSTSTSINIIKDTETLSNGASIVKNHAEYSLRGKKGVFFNFFFLESQQIKAFIETLCRLHEDGILYRANRLVFRDSSLAEAQPRRLGDSTGKW